MMMTVMETDGTGTIQITKKPHAQAKRERATVVTRVNARGNLKPDVKNQGNRAHAQHMHHTGRVRAKLNTHRHHKKKHPKPNRFENYQNKRDMSKYILKSEIVPPVCPACPAVTSRKNCQPCPPCARCPEPSFECKKVPNYSGGSLSAIPGIGPWGGAGAGARRGRDPMPLLNSFSGFS